MGGPQPSTTHPKHMEGKTDIKKKSHRKSNEEESGVANHILTDWMWKLWWRQNTCVSVQRRWYYLGKIQKITDKIGGVQQIGSPNSIWDNACYICLAQDQPPNPTQTLPNPIARAFRKQGEIGWLHALIGLMSHNRAELQNSHLQYLGAKITGEIWISSTIRKTLGLTQGV